MEQNKLNEILEKHELWLKNGSGVKANLSYVDLSYARLDETNLSYANLVNANLSYANLIFANLNDANLSGANLFYATLSNANLSGANLYCANLSNANLSNANLSGANLHSANLRCTDLPNANLQGTNLSGTDLSSAELRGAKHLSLKFRSDLNILKFQKGKIIAFKYLDSNMTSIYQGFRYEIGKKYSCKDYDSDEKICCGEGFNVATLEWCLKDAKFDKNKIYVMVEFNVNDIIAIPYNSNGKFRVKKMKIVRKVTEEELNKIIDGEI